MKFQSVGRIPYLALFAIQQDLVSTLEVLTVHQRAR